jgi:hypothetical protein
MPATTVTSNTLKAIGLLFSLVLVRSAMAAQPVITSPAPGSTLPSSSATFQWSSGTEVTDYFLYVGSGVGANDIYNTNASLNLSATVSGLPTNGMTLYVRLWWLTAAGWQSGDYTYTAPGITTAFPAMISPVPGSTLPSSSATFQWSSGTGVTKYFLYVGSIVGASNVYSRNESFNLSDTVTNLPVNGMTLYVRLWWLTAAGWQSGDYTYTAAGTSTPFPAMINPVPGSTLTSSSATFQWTGGTGVAKYYLYVGSSAGATNIYNQNENLNVSATVTGLPTNGMTLYVRLWWLVSATWQSGDYTYKAVTTLGALRQGGNLIVSWPTNDPAYWLEYATNLPASAWISNPISPSILKGRYTVTNGTSYPFTIYRLTK